NGAEERSVALSVPIRPSGDRCAPLPTAAGADGLLGQPRCQSQCPEARYSFDWHDSRHDVSRSSRDPAYSKPFPIFLNISHGPPWLPQIETSERATPSRPSRSLTSTHRKSVVSWFPWMK